MRRDFPPINDILARVVPTARDSVGALSPLDQVGARTDERILDFSVRQSRDKAWYNAVLLAGQNEEEREATIERLDIRAAVLARLVARPGGLVRSALRLIRSTESDDVSAVITHLDNAMARPSARQGTGRAPADRHPPRLTRPPAGCRGPR